MTKKSHKKSCPANGGDKLPIVTAEHTFAGGDCDQIRDSGTVLSYTDIMKVLIVYGTNSTGTLDVAEIVRDVFVEKAHTADMRTASDVQPGDLQRFDLVILGSCSWMRLDGHTFLEGQLQDEMFRFVASLEGKTFHKQRFAVFSLGDSRYDQFCASADHLEHLVERVGGNKIGMTLRLDQFFYNLAENRNAAEWWARHLERLFATGKDEFVPKTRNASNVRSLT